jgi:hypothetical protein
MKILKILSLTAVAFLLTQCYPDGPTYVDELDIVYSTYDPTYDFTIKHTFAIPDSIMKIDDKLIAGGNPDFVKDQFARVMLDRIILNMENAGWERVAKDKDPDVLLFPSAYEITTTVYDFGTYWNWWYPGGGWFYPFPVASFTTGSLIVDMIDPHQLSADDRPLVAWLFFVNGLLQGNTANFNPRVTSAIDQAFIQSPYLKKVKI